MPSGNLSLQVQLNMQDALKGLQSIGNAFTNFAGNIAKGGMAALNFTNAITAIVQVLTVLRDAIKAVINAMVEWMDMSIELTFAEQKLLAVLEATGKVVDGNIALYKANARELAGNSIYSTNRYIEAQSRLAFFTELSQDSFNRATDAAGDLSALIGSSLPQAALQLGRSLNDPRQGLELLAQSGITFTESQKEMIIALHEVGDAASAQSLQLRFLEERIGTVAEEMRDSGAGAAIRLGTAINELKRELGQELLEGLRPGIESLIELIEELTVMVDSGALEGIVDVVNVLSTFLANAVKGINVTLEAIEQLDKSQSYNALQTLMDMTGAGGILKGASTINDIIQGMSPPVTPTLGPGTEEEEERARSAKAALDFMDAMSESQKRLDKFTAQRIKEQEKLAESIKAMIDPTFKLSQEFETMQSAIERGFLSIEEATQYVEQQRQALIDRAKKEDDERDKGFQASLVGLEEAGNRLQEMAASREEDKVEKAITETAKRAEEQRNTQIDYYGKILTQLKEGLVARAG